MKKKILVDPENWINENYDSEFELDDLLYDISMKIFDERIRRKLNQKEFADLLGVNQSMVSKLESGEYNPSIKQLFKISKKLNLELVVVINKEEYKTSKNIISN